MTTLFAQHLLSVIVLYIVLKIQENIHRILVVSLEQMQQQTFNIIIPTSKISIQNTAILNLKYELSYSNAA